MQTLALLGQRLTSGARIMAGLLHWKLIPLETVFEQGGQQVDWCESLGSREWSGCRWLPIGLLMW